ncbi:MAG: TIGR03862 family flavoprotein [Pseudomonadota bacterium]
MVPALVIGAGPAGLMAASELGSAGIAVLLAEAKPSVARKFLMAGKSGLNLTKDEDDAVFLRAYGAASDWLAPMLAEFGPLETRNWARGLGQDLFTGSTGRVFPKTMKASPLLRAWLERLGAEGTDIRTRWRWCGWTDGSAVFDTPEGQRLVDAQVTILALGGGSWARLGSDGAWFDILSKSGVSLTRFKPSNAALSVGWSDHMQSHFGAALKSVKWTAGEATSRGEATISAHGLEGGGLYPLTPALRDGATLSVDLVPDIPAATLEQRLASKSATLRLSHWLRNSLRLSAAKVALFHEMSHKPGRPDWVHTVKSLPIEYAGLRPIDEAISTAGGVKWCALNDDLMLHAMPGVFCAGEMLDWEAPTGGYLLTGCLSLGRWAGRAAARRLGQ